MMWNRTFDYVVTVPEEGIEAPFPWKVKPRQPFEYPEHEHRDTQLLGPSPNLEITDAGTTPDSPSHGLGGHKIPKVRRNRFTLSASEKTNSVVAKASFCVDKDLVSNMRAGDVVYISKSVRVGLGISILRDGQLAVAVGAVTTVPLGNELTACVPWELAQEAEAVFRARDPSFEYLEVPIEVGIGDSQKLLFRGWHELGWYKIYAVHGALNGMPGINASLGISRIGVFPETVASFSALLLDSAEAVEVLNW